MKPSTEENTNRFKNNWTQFIFHRIILE